MVWLFDGYRSIDTILLPVQKKKSWSHTFCLTFLLKFCVEFFCFFFSYIFCFKVVGMCLIFSLDTIDTEHLASFCCFCRPKVKVIDLEILLTAVSKFYVKCFALLMFLKVPT